jgi:tetratricopeptide (TPR) repeat protein
MRAAVTILLIAFCLFLIQVSGRFGFSRMLARYAVVTDSLQAADQAVQLTPFDPDVHRSRATILSRLQRTEEAAHSLATATSLRYRDDTLWIDLGNTREELGDTDGALAALDQAVRWAPHYAHTHWQRGNLLLRMRRPGDAFSELRQATNANPAYTPNLIDLAWGISGENISTTESLIDIKDDTTRLALTRYLARKGKGREVANQLPKIDQNLVAETSMELARLLFAAKQYRDAFDFYSDIHHDSNLPINGGFEDPIAFNDDTFGWIIAPDQRSRAAIDVSEKFRGAKSLQINFDGAWTPGAPLLSQTIVADPFKTYRLSFAVRTKDLVTGGPPVILVIDAASNQILGRSENLPTATTPWRSLNLNFSTTATSNAVIIRLQRNNCDSSPCPIFGTLWVDEFHIEQTKDPSPR